MDANEFFNTLFDKLEGLLKPSAHQHMLTELFGYDEFTRYPCCRKNKRYIYVVRPYVFCFSGKLANQLISKECDHTSERDEPFYSVSVEIKNKENIEQSFDLFVEGEMLTGDNKYFCDRCGEARETLKRSVKFSNKLWLFIIMTLWCLLLCGTGRALRNCLRYWSSI